MPGSSALEVESPAVATVDDVALAGWVRTHQAPAPGPPGGHGESLVSETSRAIAELGRVEATARPATTATAAPVTSTRRRTESRSHGTPPVRIGSSSR